MQKKNKAEIVFFLIALMMFCLSFGTSGSGARAEDEVESGPSQYLIGPSDVLNIFVWKEPELTRDITVMPNGGITFPLIGEIMAQGKTVTELKGAITEKLKEYVAAPEVTVIVLESKSRRVYVIGKVIRVGPFALDQNMTVIQALSTAGGFAEWADQKNILIVRRQGNKEVQFRFNYREFISGQHVEQNIVLEPNDTIVVR